MLKIKKEAELRAIAAGVEVRPNDPSRLKLEDATRMFIGDQELLNRGKKTIAAYRQTMDSFLKSCTRTFLDQVDRRDLLHFANDLRKEGLSDRTVYTRWVAVMTVLKYHGIRGLTKRGDTPQFVERSQYRRGTDRALRSLQA